MKKDKYLHRNGSSNKWKVKKNTTKNKYGDFLPFRESIRNVHKLDECSYYYNCIDFSPLYKFLEENINRNWNSVYTEILKRTKSKFRYELEKYHLSPLRDRVMIIDYIPYIKRYGRLPIALNVLFIDEENILRMYDSKDELKRIALIKKRKEKLLKMNFENDE